MNGSCDDTGKPETNGRVDVAGLPPRILETYSRLWQLETWLRHLVYVELRALAGDNWALKVSGADRPKAADKRLTHMPSPEDNPLSYAQLSSLCRIVSEHWQLFEPFLPPKSIWEAKIEEVSQIRHRVAHFRSGHHDDLQRVHQLLRDIDQGFWRFCTSYNDPTPVLPQSDDPVEEHFLHLDPFPWGKVGERGWARFGSADPQARLGTTVEVLCRPWASWAVPVAGKEGFLYDVKVHARQNRELDYTRLLQSTLSVHEHVVHICLDHQFRCFRITVPAVLGAEQVIQITERFVDAALNSLSYGLKEHQEGAAKKLADAWPEYVLEPENPLSFLGADMPCSFFGV